MPTTASNGFRTKLDVFKSHTPQARLGLLASLFCLVLFSAAALADRSALEQQLEHRRWTLNDDSPSQIGALAEARDGYLWLGTHDSLYRFDGFDFTRYRTPAGQELGIVSSLLASDSGFGSACATAAFT